MCNRGGAGVPCCPIMESSVQRSVSMRCCKLMCVAKKQVRHGSASLAANAGGLGAGCKFNVGAGCTDGFEAADVSNFGAVDTIAAQRCRQLQDAGRERRVDCIYCSK